MTTTEQRHELVTAMEYMISQAGRIHYAEIRPIPRFASLPKLKEYFLAGHTLTTDCSGAVTLLCEMCGLKDPNGQGYDGQGYTGTLLDHLPHYTDVSKGHPGALLVFGDHPGVHVCMVLERNGQNPILFSHGSEIGPLRISLDNERTAHEGEPITMLDISHL